MAHPFGSGKFDKRFDDVFAPAVAAAGLEAYRVDRDAGASVPVESIERGIRNAVAVFVDVTADNPNVWFELGYAIAAGKDMCLVCSSERAGPFPFDVQHRKIIRYSPDAPRDFEKLAEAITARLKAILAQQEKRAGIQVIVAEHQDAGLSDFETAALACLASESDGLETTVSHWMLRNEMEKARFNKLACNVGVRNLRGRDMVRVITVDGQDGPYEAYCMTENGWNWITRNTHALNLTAPAKKKKGGFDSALSDDIPF